MANLGTVLTVHLDELTDVKELLERIGTLEHQLTNLEIKNAELTKVVIRVENHVAEIYRKHIKF